MARTIMIDEFTKVEITDNNMVQYFELMGSRWVSLGEPEKWSDELIAEEF